DAILGMEVEVQALEPLRHQYAEHEHRMMRCQAQLDQLWKAVVQRLNELGPAWHDRGLGGQGDAAAVQALQARLPGLQLRKSLEQLLRHAPVLSQSLEAARVAEGARRGEMLAIQAKLDGQPAIKVSPELRAALEREQTLGDTDIAEQK